MNERKKQVAELVRPGRELNGVTKVLLGEDLHVTINVKHASFNKKPYSELSFTERKNFEDLLYLSNIQTGNVQFHYV